MNPIITTTIWTLIFGGVMWVIIHFAKKEIKKLKKK